MIIAIGIDSVDIQRFKQWHTYNDQQLLKLFTPQEIAYCLQEKTCTAQRFAARFAVKEAAFKAFCAATSKKPPFFSFCKTVEVTNIPCPQATISYDGLPRCIIHCSITHTQQTATAVIIFEK